METLRIKPGNQIEPLIIDMGLSPVIMELFFIFGKYGIFPPFFIGTGSPEDIHNYEIEHGGEYILEDRSFLLSKKEDKPFILIDKEFLFSESSEWRVRLETLKAGHLMVEIEKGTVFSFPNLDTEMDYLEMVLREYMDGLNKMWEVI